MRHLALVPAVVALALAAPGRAQVVTSGAGPAAADIQPAVEAFRLQLGVLNPNVAGSFGSGRREINWDGVPTAQQSPNSFDPAFFNAATAGRARGVVFSTPGAGFQVSADGVPGQFANLNANYPDFFEPFSPARLFTAIGSNVVEVSFFLPGTATPALSAGFGSVFSDVDLANATSLQFFDATDQPLGTFFAPATFGNQTFSFLGVAFSAPLISRVRITSGTRPLAPNVTATDLVVMDDFIYGEPSAVPEPSTALTGFALFAAIATARRRRR